jgi:hypothetical protein
MLRHGFLVIDLLASGNRRGWNENITGIRVWAVCLARNEKPRPAQVRPGRGCRAARPSFGDEISYLLTGDQVVVELSYL